MKITDTIELIKFLIGYTLIIKCNKYFVVIELFLNLVNFNNHAINKPTKVIPNTLIKEPPTITHTYTMLRILVDTGKVATGAHLDEYTTPNDNSNKHAKYKITNASTLLLFLS